MTARESHRPVEAPVIQLRRADEAERAQREREARMLDATIALAREGGFDAVQMRTVADEAGVALGTLYRYFPSKGHLLVSGLIRRFEAEAEALQRLDIPGELPSERVYFVLDRLTTRLLRERKLAEAVTRAFMFADAGVSAEVDEVGRLLDGMLGRALDPGWSGDGGRGLNDVSRVICDVWMANLVCWLTDRATAEQVTQRLQLTVRLLLDDVTL